MSQQSLDGGSGTFQSGSTPSLHQYESKRKRMMLAASAGQSGSGASSSTQQQLEAGRGHPPVDSPLNILSLAASTVDRRHPADRGVRGPLPLDPGLEDQEDKPKVETEQELGPSSSTASRHSNQTDTQAVRFP